MTEPRTPHLDPVTIEIAKVMPELRKAYGMNQAELADAMNTVAVRWSRTTVVKIETNRRDSIRAYEVVGLANVFDIDLAVLMDPEQCARIRVTTEIHVPGR